MRKKTVRRNKNISKHIKSGHKRIKNPLPIKPEGWDRNLSFTANLNQLNVNNLQINDKVTEFTKTKIQVEEVSIAELNKMRLGKLKEKIKLTIDEEWAIEALHKKFGTQFEVQAKDHKANSFQWTAVQCKKKYDSYIKRHGKCPK